MSPELKALTASPQQETKALEAVPSAEPTNNGLSFFEQLSPEEQDKFLEAVENNNVEQGESKEHEPAVPAAKIGEAALDKTTQAPESIPVPKPEAPRLAPVPAVPEVQPKPAPPKRSPVNNHADSHHSSQQPSMRADSLRSLQDMRDLTQELTTAKQGGEGRRHRRVHYEPTAQQPAVEHHAEKPQPPESRPPQSSRQPEPEQPRQSRQEFVKQQEERWGANDKHEAGSVPEGEMTWEQYLTQRPKGEAGDTYHIHDVNGKERILEVTTGKQLNAEQRGAVETARAQENPTDHYAVQAEKRELERAHEAAIAEDETKEKAWGDIIRSNVEGAILAQKDPRLQGLLSFGKELNALHGSKPGPDFEKNMKDYEEKKALFNYMLKQFHSDGTFDDRALMYIGDVTGALDDPDFIAVEGGARYKGEKVTVTDLIESPEIEGVASKTAYTITHENGEAETVNAGEVTFKREFAVPEQETEKLSPFQRVKKWFKNEGAKIRQYGGKAYLGNLWDRAATAVEEKMAGSWLTERHITEDMTPEQVQAQKLRNRRNNVLGLAVIVGTTVIASRMGIFAGTMLEGHGLNADALPQHPGGATSFNIDTLHKLKEVGPTPVQSLPLEGAPNGTDTLTSPVDLGVNDPSYNIPSGGQGLELFATRGLDSQKWYDNAQTLLNRFPQDFYLDHGDVRLAHSGELSLGARQFIESLRG